MFNIKLCTICFYVLGAITTADYQKKLSTYLIAMYITSPFPHVLDFSYGLKMKKFVTGESQLKDLRSFGKFKMLPVCIINMDVSLTIRIHKHYFIIICSSQFCTCEWVWCMHLLTI